MLLNQKRSKLPLVVVDIQGQTLLTSGGFSQAVSKVPAGTNRELPGSGRPQLGPVSGQGLWLPSYLLTPRAFCTLRVETCETAARSLCAPMPSSGTRQQNQGWSRNGQPPCHPFTAPSALEDSGSGPGVGRAELAFGHWGVGVGGRPPLAQHVRPVPCRWGLTGRGPGLSAYVAHRGQRVDVLVQCGPSGRRRRLREPGSNPLLLRAGACVPAAAGAGGSHH